MTGIETVAAVAALAGTAVAAYGTYQSGQAQQDAQKYNAKLAENEALATEQASAVRMRAQRAEARRLQGRQAALYGMAGVDEAGSPLLVMADQARQSELAIVNDRWAAERAAQNLRAGGRLRRFEGSQAAKAGTIGATSTLLSGASSAAMAYGKGGGYTGGYGP